MFAELLLKKMEEYDMELLSSSGFMEKGEVEHFFKKCEKELWHPVSEPPKDSGFYLCDLPGTIRPFYYTSGIGWESACGKNVRAWMPLPEPYKKEE